MSVHRILVVLLITVLASLAWAADKPDLSGKWVLNLGKSTLATPGIEAGTVRITHQEPRFHFARTFQTRDGRDNLTFDATTDGAERTTRSDGMTTRSRLHWEGQELVLDETTQVGSRTATNVVHYSLSDGGKVLIARESFRGPRLQYDNTWMFDRQ
ncbi:MAG TPA: hypothetical protein PLS53_03205 [Thermoanaerobaculaceae bacterium]|nr:hypothetical protein [Thermoanaerobaculaceae bacterium]HPS77143.1 hypothetical protein [Thermoanaerobaculaceae bacterium]